VENIRKLEINRLIKELDYVKSDFNYKSELLQEADSDFIKSVDSFLDTHPQLKQVFNEKILERQVPKAETIIEEPVLFQDFIEETSIEEIKETEIVDEVKDPKLKSLYRSIAKSTHPDKIKDESLKELYLEATNAYDNNNILPILAICDKLRIPYEVTEEETNLIKSEIQSLKSRVSFLETTFTWQWYNQTDVNIREAVILSYIKAQLAK
jgi:hypothetical protein